MREIEAVERDLMSVWERLVDLIGVEAPAFEAELLLLLRDLDGDSTQPAARHVRALILEYAETSLWVQTVVTSLLETTRTLSESGSVELDGASDEDDFEAEAVPTEAVSPRHVAVPIWYATDRDHRPDGDPSHRYGKHRAERKDDGSLLNYGLASVSIPDGHRRGRMESPKWYKLEFRENPDKHITVLSVDEFDRTAWMRSLHDAAGDAGATETSQDLLVFVHGYCTSWAEAIKRAAQFSYDIEFDGRTIAYTWPSQGKTLAYTADENLAAWSAPHFTEFMRDLLANSDARRVHLVAHSMGNRLTTAALRDLALIGPAGPAFLGKVVFAAPDVDTGIFSELIEKFHKDVAAVTESLRPHLTLYSCSVDAALDLSSGIHGMARAGLTREGKVVVMAPMETVEVSKIVLDDDRDDIVGHAYFCSNRTVIADLNRLVLKNELAGAPRFGLKPSTDGRFWEIRR